jgi:hypothetical protein
MMKKQITLQDLFNKMDENFDRMWAEFTDLQEKLTQITGNNSENSTQNSKNDIPDTEYVTITADDVLVGGESATEYHGEKIYNLYHCPAYFKEARDIIREENSCELLEIHCLQSSTEGEWLKTGNPVADKNGEKCWIRIKFKDMAGAERVSLWAFDDTFSSDSVCASGCAFYCGGSVRDGASLRAGLFGSVGVN